MTDCYFGSSKFKAVDNYKQIRSKKARPLCSSRAWYFMGLLQPLGGPVNLGVQIRESNLALVVQLHQDNRVFFDVAGQDGF